MTFKRLDLYTAAGAEFNSKTGADDIHDDRAVAWKQKTKVTKEEVEELQELVEGIQGEDVEWVDEYEGHMAEEMADIIYTVFTMAHAMDVDIHGAFMTKHRYNIQKSGSKMEDGKVVDDSDTPKPDFTKFVQGGDR